MPTSAVRIKICGITQEADAQAAVLAGADALGLNFYAGSPRYLSEDRALRIVRDLPPFVEPVALFVNESYDQINARLERFGSVRTVQVHGDSLAPCPAGPLRIIPAFPVKDAGSLTRIRDYVALCRQRGRLPAAVLVDAHVPGAYGGSGQRAPWDLLADFDAGVPLILAGGLNAENVAEAVKRVRPYAVDVASGVETSPGRKDVEMMRRFIDNARSV